MDVHAVRLDIAHQVALQIITYIGCIISVVCLVLAILTFQLFRGLKVINNLSRAIPCFAPVSNFRNLEKSCFSFFQSDRTTIHKNLCVCLLIAEILFVCGIGQTNQRIVCGIVAGLLHFFFLCAFAWMFLEGIYTTLFRKYYPLHVVVYRILERRISGSMCQSLILPWNFFPRLPIIRDADRGVRSGKIKVTLVLSDRLRCSVTGRGHFLYNRSSQLRNRSILLATGGQLLHLQLRWTSDTRYIGKIREQGGTGQIVAN